MFDTILVPLDGSQMADCVLPHVAAIASPFNAEVTLLRMLEKNQAGPSAQLFDLLNWQINKTRSALYLEKIKELFEGSGIRTNALVLEGLVAEGIAEYAQQQEIKLIVLSSHGRSGLTQWGISSVTQKIVLIAQTSLMIVRAYQYGTYAEKLSTAPLYKRIMVPLDGSQRAENVLPVVMQLAQFHKSQVHLVHVVETPEMARQMPPTPEDVELANRVVERNREEAEHYLEHLKSRSYLKDIDIRTHLIASEDATVALHQFEEHTQCDLVIFNAHGYSGHHQWPYGSMVNHFILYGKAPLLIVQDLPFKQEPISPEVSTFKRIEY